MRDLHTFGFDMAPGAYRGTIPPRPELAFHRFELDADGCLRHYIADMLRAIVPPEGARDYAELWPACASLVDELLAADR